MESIKLLVKEEENPKIIKIKDLRPLYLYISRSASILEEKIEGFKKLLRGKINFESDFKIFYAGSDMDESDFLNFVKTPSLFSEGRVAVIKNLEKASFEFIRTLMGIFKSSGLPWQGAVIIITCLSGEKKAKNLAELTDMAHKLGAVEVLYAPTAEKLGKWLSEKSELDGVQFTQKASARFIENVNFDLNTLKTEYEKLLIYISSEKEKIINEVTVDKLISRVYDMKIFDLVECIGNRDRTGALKVLKPLALEKQNMIGIITLLHRMFSSFIYLKSGESKYSNGPYMGTGTIKPNASAINSFKDFIEKSIGHAKNKEKIAANYMKYSKKYSAPEVIKVFEILNRYDIMLRAAEINESIMVAKLIAEITQVTV